MKFISAGAKAYLRYLPNAELLLLNAGHFAVEEKGREIAILILNFLKNNQLKTSIQSGKRPEKNPVMTILFFGSLQISSKVILSQS